ncbi:aromatic alcohol reductase [Stenotrophomonas sp. 24(2023)]|uniref:aromatic alcohol reductase n=1 Tax=Stenotrophomonas sp. 24(2023) TaxID=3068324 RepID=UPI0027E16D74|nr:aromatic alcohol reductase [Stenotrophomonas sp. 24(2023)]WMJ68951.1 aromatic alcohol reductase [Stenotrophomonas sp. 24(2023)]
MNQHPHPPTRTLVLGAGELGSQVLRELALQREHGHIATLAVLLRPAADDATAERQATDTLMQELGIAIVEADLAQADEPTLAAIFATFDQVICCTGFVGGSGTQRRITAAVLRAGVPHYIPWQFGVDYDVVGRGSGQAVWDEQLDVRGMLRGQQAVRWTIISTGMFTSFVPLPAFGLVDLQHGIVRALGDWDHQLTVTTPQDIGRLTARIAARWPAFANQVVHVAGDTFSYRELADTLERVLGRPMERELWQLAQLRADALAHPDDGMRQYRVAFARADGVAWPKAGSYNAREGITTTGLEDWLRANLRGARR